MKELKNREQLIHGILSVTCPLVTVASVMVYQSVRSVPEDNISRMPDDVAGAMNLMSFILVSCLVGLGFACANLLTKPKTRAGSVMGYLGMAINGPPLFLAFVLITGR